ncbi:regulator of (H+)-ATPase in vacuolar membrane [Ascosphaera pollenicola]|nr:regulator of (H+)-ATPase in vacuolar membrane [Ascosphaera pollenicola]
MDGHYLFASREDLCHIEEEVKGLYATQLDHSERLVRLERKRQDDARMTNVWGNSAFPLSPLASFGGGIRYTSSGKLKTWTAKVDETGKKVQWLRTSVVETGINNPSVASGTSIRKAAVADQDRTTLTIWDTKSAQLEFEETFDSYDTIRDLDWTSTPDDQSILAVGFPQKVVLIVQSFVGTQLEVRAVD